MQGDGARTAARDSAALPLGTRRLGLRQLLLLRRRPGRFGELEGDVLRIIGRRNSITVDKPPGALWIMALSVRIFGLNSWSILVPQALEGVAAVGMLYLAVRRTSGAAAGILAGAVLAVTPVAALMFRFNNPDSLLLLLMIAGGYGVIRALETASTKWLILVGVLTGFGFLTKMLQALLVVPAFALVYLFAAPNPVGRRILQLLAAGGALVVSAGWWIAIVSLIPAKDRPYIGGSQHNSILELTLGYNGLGRLTGNETGSVGGGGGNGGGGWGTTGATRLFGTEMGTQISWLLPTSLLLLVGGLWFTRKGVRTDRTRAGLLLWGGWLVVTGLVFSYAKGIIHPYYTVALAPAIGGVIGVAATLLWRNRHQLTASILLSLSVLLTAVWQFELLDRTPAWLPWLRYAILVTGLASGLLLIVVSRLGRRAGPMIAAVALIASLGGASAYAISTVRTPHSGSIPSAGPASTGGFGGPGGGGGARMGGQPPTGGFPAARATSVAQPKAARAQRKAALAPRRPAPAQRRPDVVASVAAPAAGCSTRARQRPPLSMSSRRTRRSTPGWRQPSAPTVRPDSSWRRRSR